MVPQPYSFGNGHTSFLPNGEGNAVIQRGGEMPLGWGKV